LGECGACAVLLDGEPVLSCLVLGVECEGRNVTTVEGLAENGQLHPLQEAFADHGAAQCGYCTPGILITAKALLDKEPHPSRERIAEALSGNLCRCTGYRPIRDAARAVGAPDDEQLAARLTKPAPVLDAVSVGGFTRPSSVAECVSVLQRDPSAKLLAGGTDLAVDSNLRAARWNHLVSVEAIDELHGFEETSDRVRIGAAVALADIGRQWTTAPPTVREWLTLFASPPIRNRATLGGNLATASPIGDAAPLLLALDARVEIAGAAGRRSVALAEFFLDYRRTALVHGELLVSVEIPAPLPAVLAFYKVAKRRADDISTVAAAMAIDRDAAGRVRSARFAFGGVAATPVRLVDAERAIAGGPWNESAVQAVQHVIAKTLRPLSDHRGSAEYRLQVAQHLVEKFAWEHRA
jgi:xanthine dehydrogenase small subunit